MAIWSRILVKFFLLSLTVCFLSATSSNRQEEVNINTQNRPESYELKFDFEQYPKEREIAYQYYSSDVFQDKDFPIARDEIAVALYDLDDDGQDEIFALLNHNFYCGNHGCTLIVFKSEKDQNAPMQIKYKPIKFGSSEYDTELSIYDVTPLKSKTLGFHDLLFEGGDGGYIIWKWQGEYYALDKRYDENVIEVDSGL